MEEGGECGGVPAGAGKECELRGPLPAGDRRNSSRHRVHPRTARFDGSHLEARTLESSETRAEHITGT